MDVRAFLDAVVSQDADRMRPFFADGAVVCWHCTHERFTVEEYIRVNCEYPGRWMGEVERVERTEAGMVAVSHVYGPGGAPSFHAVSFLKIRGGRIAALDEYWADDGPAPEWRRGAAME